MIVNEFFRLNYSRPGIRSPAGPPTFLEKVDEVKRFIARKINTKDVKCILGNYGNNQEIGRL